MFRYTAAVVVCLTCSLAAFADGYLGSTRFLSPDTAVYSGNGRFALALQLDGNVVLTDLQGVATPIFATGTNGRGGNRLIMQADGNLVLYAGNQAIWASGTQGNPGAYLAVQNDGNVVIYSGGRAVWATGTNR